MAVSCLCWQNRGHTTPHPWDYLTFDLPGSCTWLWESAVISQVADTEWEHAGEVLFAVSTAVRSKMQADEHICVSRLVLVLCKLISKMLGLEGNVLCIIKAISQISFPPKQDTIFDGQIGKKTYLYSMIFGYWRKRRAGETILFIVAIIHSSGLLLYLMHISLTYALSPCFSPPILGFNKLRECGNGAWGRPRHVVVRDTGKRKQLNLGL